MWHISKYHLSATQTKILIKKDDISEIFFPQEWFKIIIKETRPATLKSIIFFLMA